MLKLPPGKKNVNLFVDKDTESMLTTESTGSEGQSNFFRAQLDLGELDGFGRMYRSLRLLKTLYVINVERSSEDASVT